MQQALASTFYDLKSRVLNGNGVYHMGRRKNCQLSKITNELQLGAIFYYLTLEWAFLSPYHYRRKKYRLYVEGQTGQREF